MATFDMEKITEYLERSMQNCSLSNQRTRVGDGTERSWMKNEIHDHDSIIGDKTLELNSHISVPSHLKQCLDLKTGEIYYVNWNNGMRVNQDPRKSVSSSNNGDEFSGGSYGSMFSEEDNSYCESEESSSESSPSSRERHNGGNEDDEEEEVVLVVAGCKACFMYFMVPKLLEDCPKCAAQLLHFPHSASP